mgnify:CR=1 FL=1
MTSNTHRAPSRAPLLLLLVPAAAFMAVPLYNRVTPQILGVPFFHAWLFAWLPLTAAITWFVHLRLGHEAPAGDAP